MLDIGLEVKILRERIQMSAKDLAEKIGLSQSQMSRLEKGQRRIDTRVLARIADALGVEPSSFVAERLPPEGLSSRGFPGPWARRFVLSAENAIFQSRMLPSSSGSRNTRFGISRRESESSIRGWPKKSPGS